MTSPGLHDRDVEELFLAFIERRKGGSSISPEAFLREQSAELQPLLRPILDDWQALGRDLQPNEEFEEFRLLRKLGQGQTATVWEAAMARAGGCFALKILFPHLALPTQVVRFHREADVGTRLSHAGIVRVHRSGTWHGYHFLVMDLVPGGYTLAHQLAELRQKHELPAGHFRLAAERVLTIAQAIQHAHEHRVLHRDIKPANILLHEDGRPVVSDFGLALLHDSPMLTRSGDFLGTYAYSSPEQVAAKRVPLGPQSDVFSLGATLYELLTLNRAFPGDSREQVIEKILMEDPPDPRAIRSLVPVELAAICLRALEKRKHLRYQTMEELARELNGFLLDTGVRARAPSRMRRVIERALRRRVRTAAWFLLSVSLGLVGFGLLRETTLQARLEASAAGGFIQRGRQEIESGDAIPGFLHSVTGLTLAPEGDSRRSEARGLARWAIQAGGPAHALDVIDRFLLGRGGTDERAEALELRCDALGMLEMHREAADAAQHAARLFGKSGCTSDATRLATRASLLRQLVSRTFLPGPPCPEPFVEVADVAGDDGRDEVVLLRQGDPGSGSHSSRWTLEVMSWRESGWRSQLFEIDLAADFPGGLPGDGRVQPRLARVELAGGGRRLLLLTEPLDLDHDEREEASAPMRWIEPDAPGGLSSAMVWMPSTGFIAASLQPAVGPHDRPVLAIALWAPRYQLLFLDPETLQLIEGMEPIGGISDTAGILPWRDPLGGDVLWLLAEGHPRALGIGAYSTSSSVPRWRIELGFTSFLQPLQWGDPDGTLVAATCWRSTVPSDNRGGWHMGAVLLEKTGANWQVLPLGPDWAAFPGTSLQPAGHLSDRPGLVVQVTCLVPLQAGGSGIATRSQWYLGDDDQFPLGSSEWARAAELDGDHGDTEFVVVPKAGRPLEVLGLPIASFDGKAAATGGPGRLPLDDVLAIWDGLQHFGAEAGLKENACLAVEQTVLRFGLVRGARRALEAAAPLSDPGSADEWRIILDGELRGLDLDPRDTPIPALPRGTRGSLLSWEGREALLTLAGRGLRTSTAGAFRPIQGGLWPASDAIVGPLEESGWRLRITPGAVGGAIVKSCEGLRTHLEPAPGQPVCLEATIPYTADFDLRTCEPLPLRWAPGVPILLEVDLLVEDLRYGMALFFGLCQGDRAAAAVEFGIELLGNHTNSTAGHDWRFQPSHGLRVDGSQHDGLQTRAVSLTRGGDVFRMEILFLPGTDRLALLRVRRRDAFPDQADLWRCLTTWAPPSASSEPWHFVISSHAFRDGTKGAELEQRIQARVTLLHYAVSEFGTD